MLLINGMPVIHIELKANSIDIHDAKNSNPAVFKAWYFQ